jgi:hypothetical protein
MLTSFTFNDGARVLSTSALVTTVTNLDSGKFINVNLSGSSTLKINSDGSATLDVRGGTAVTPPFSDTLLLVNGVIRLRADSSGNVTEAIFGRTTDLCAVLGP